MPVGRHVDSSNGAYRAYIEYGDEMPSELTSGYGKPYYPTIVTVSATAEPPKKLVVWKENSESTQVTFSEDGRHVEILWEIAGCIFDSSGTRAFAGHPEVIDRHQCVDQPPRLEILARDNRISCDG